MTASVEWGVFGIALVTLLIRPFVGQRSKGIISLVQAAAFLSMAIIEPIAKLVWVMFGVSLAYEGLETLGFIPENDASNANRVTK